MFPRHLYNIHPLPKSRESLYLKIYTPTNYLSHVIYSIKFPPKKHNKLILYRIHFNLSSSSMVHYKHSLKLT